MIWTRISNHPIGWLALISESSKSSPIYLEMAGWHPWIRISEFLRHSEMAWLAPMDPDLGISEHSQGYSEAGWQPWIRISEFSRSPQVYSEIVCITRRVYVPPCYSLFPFLNFILRLHVCSLMGWQGR